MKPISQPAAQVQPDQACYGIDALALFRTYTRDSYRATFGVEAPPWDPGRRTKTWFDSNVDASSPGVSLHYNVVARDAAARWSLTPLTLPASEAATVNLPGIVAYPPYVIRPTNATRGGAPVNPMDLSLESEARALMQELGAKGLVDEGVNAFAPVFYPADEPRRMWALVGNGGLQNNAGGLLRMRSAGGIGAPGHWRNARGEVAWMSEPPAPSGLYDPRPEVEMPVRGLLPNEELRPGVMGFGVLVYRTDREREQALQSGAFTPEDRKTMEEILRTVKRLGS